MGEHMREIRCWVLLALIAGGSPQLSVAQAAGAPAADTATVFSPDRAVSPYSFVQEVLNAHPALGAARRRLEAASITARGQDQAVYNPELELRYENDREDPSLSDVRLEVRQSIDWFNKRGAQTAVSASEREMVAAELNAVRKHVAVEVLRALVDVLMNSEQAKLAQRQLTLVDQFLLAEEKRLEVGDAGRVAVDLAQLARAEASARTVTADLERRDAEQRLRVASRLQPRIWPTLPDRLPVLSEDLLVEALIDDLPEVMIANRRSKRAERNVELVDRLRRPDPKLGSEFEYSKDDGVTAIFTIGIALPVRNTYRYQVEAARSHSLAADFDAQDARVQAAMAADAAARNYRASAAAWREWEANTLSSLSEGLSRLDRQRSAGDISATNYLLQLKQRLDTRLAGVRLLQHAWNDWVTWLEATGRWEAWLEDDHRNRQLKTP